MTNYVAKANWYINQVLSGDVPACMYVRQACARQKSDLERSAREDWPYRFDARAATRVCLFIEHLRHVKGPLSGQTITLEPWQCFILTTIFGWLRKDSGKRRFKRAYVEVPRGNAKSTLSAGIGLYMMALDGEGGAGCYSFATTREQAREVFDVAREMCRRSSDVRDSLGIRVFEHALTQQKSGSCFMPKSAQGNTLDGLNTHFACIDELHAHKTREVYDVVETSIGKRLQPLLFAITTAGFDLTGICYELRTYVAEVLSGMAVSDDQFGIIYTIDKDDDWTSDAALQKANPNFGVSVVPETIKSLRDKAATMASAANNFKTKHLDVWCNSNSAWMDMQALSRCVDPNLTAEEFEGDECFIGIDLASRVDIAAMVKLFRRMVDGKPHYYAFGDYWLPRDTIETAKNSQYRGWEVTGEIHVTEGASTDFDQIEAKLLEDCSRFDVLEVPYDPFQATQFSDRMLRQNVPMIECRATVLQFSSPMKEIEAAVRDGRFHYNGDRVLTWMFSNVTCHQDAKDNIFPRKERVENKIDGVVALIMAMNRAMAIEEEYDLNEFLERDVCLRF